MFTYGGMPYGIAHCQACLQLKAIRTLFTDTLLENLRCIDTLFSYLQNIKHGRVLRYFDRAIVATFFPNCCRNRWFCPNCCRLPEVNCCMLPNPFNCCELRPKMWQMLRVAAKFPNVARCRIPQYLSTSRSLLPCK